MTDKIQKFLNKLRAEELERIIAVIRQIQSGNLANLDVKPLKGHKAHFRVRVGRVRIICKLTGDSYEILHVTNRDDQTYKSL